MNNVLTREEALENFTSPMDRTYGVVKDKKQPNLFKIALVDGRGGDIPKEFEGNFTKPLHAEQVIRAHLSNLWDMAKAKSKAK